MEEMKRFCSLCGKELTIRITPDDGEIKSDHKYFEAKVGEPQGIDFEPSNVSEQKEYWECSECYKDRENPWDDDD